MPEEDVPLFEQPAPKAVRRPLDFYETPLWMTRALLRRITITGTVFEPCNGDGAITSVLRAAGHTVITNDIDKLKKADTHLDVTKEWPVGKLPWVVSNIPFGEANIIVPRAKANAIDGVAVILRLSWLEPTKARQDFLLEYPPDAVIVLPRHSFTGNKKTDSVTSAWFVWSQYVLRGISVVTKHERDVLKVA